MCRSRRETAPGLYLTNIHDMDDMDRNEEVSQHILPTSATMLGVCITVLSIGKLAPHGSLHWMFDKLLALTSLVFLTSAALSFASIRSHAKSAQREAAAESIFLAGLALLGVVTLVIVFAVP
jgi:hypothetical protein